MNEIENQDEIDRSKNKKKIVIVPKTKVMLRATKKVRIDCVDTMSRFTRFISDICVWFIHHLRGTGSTTVRWPTTPFASVVHVLL